MEESFTYALLETGVIVDAMDILSKDFVSLPIIITDWDAIAAAKSHIIAPKEEIARSLTVSRMATASQQEPARPAFKESAEEIWNRISDTTKSKLREAALEVLRRTDECQNEKMTFQYDDDARFLD
ncbi:hypothetical protein PRZ48_001590 [Zasmidium cellare]|uniref:Uncharacterized protein n=1 Tax=Zasmidium cellare TaxID=395010 RepID=A0ABR0F3J9_ZASCE|nr:hypothetical protein PRZ48_001590 [Zasmidium cellare]